MRRFPPKLAACRAVDGKKAECDQLDGQIVQAIGYAAAAHQNGNCDQGSELDFGICNADRPGPAEQGQFAPFDWLGVRVLDPLPPDMAIMIIAASAVPPMIQTIPSRSSSSSSLLANCGAIEACLVAV